MYLLHRPEECYRVAMPHPIPRYYGTCPIPGCRGRATHSVDQLAVRGISWIVCSSHAEMLLRSGGTAHRIRPDRPRRRLLRA